MREYTNKSEQKRNAKEKQTKDFKIVEEITLSLYPKRQQKKRQKYYEANKTI